LGLNTAKISSSRNRSEVRASLLGPQAVDRNFAPYAGGGYHERQGLTGPAATPSNKMYRPNSLWTWSFLLVAIIQACIALGLEGFVILVDAPC